MDHTPRFPIGTKFKSPGKHPRICTVTDFHVTRNLAGEVVRSCYVATHEFCGQTVTDRQVPSATIARNIITEPTPP